MSDEGLGTRAREYKLMVNRDGEPECLGTYHTSQGAQYAGECYMHNNAKPGETCFVKGPNGEGYWSSAMDPELLK